MLECDLEEASGDFSFAFTGVQWRDFGPWNTE